jgi:phage-related protein
VRTGRPHAVWGFVSIERRPARRRSENGFEDFLERHSDKSAGDVGQVQERWPVGRPLVGKLGGGLCEVRTTFDKNEYRVFFYIEREQVVVVHSTMVLVHGIHKKTQKTPAADLALAQRRMKEGT